jgi:hypothetical protein
VIYEEEYSFNTIQNVLMTLPSRVKSIEEKDRRILIYLGKTVTTAYVDISNKLAAFNSMSDFMLCYFFRGLKDDLILLL